MVIVPWQDPHRNWPTPAQEALGENVIRLVNAHLAASGDFLTQRSWFVTVEAGRFVSYDGDPKNGAVFLSGNIGQHLITPAAALSGNVRTSLRRAACYEHKQRKGAMSVI